jgi:hypothetical protein
MKNQHFYRWYFLSVIIFGTLIIALLFPHVALLQASCPTIPTLGAIPRNRCWEGGAQVLTNIHSNPDPMGFTSELTAFPCLGWPYLR